MPPRPVQRERTSNSHSSSGEWPSTNPIRAHREKRPTVPRYQRRTRVLPIFRTSSTYNTRRQHEADLDFPLIILSFLLYFVPEHVLSPGLASLRFWHDGGSSLG